MGSLSDVPPRVVEPCMSAWRAWLSAARFGVSFGQKGYHGSLALDKTVKAHVLLNPDLRGEAPEVVRDGARAARALADRPAHGLERVADDIASSEDLGDVGAALMIDAQVACFIA